MHSKRILTTGFYLWTSLVSTQVRPQALWQQLPGPYGGSVREIIVHPNGALFAGTDGGVFRSTDNGDTWQRMPLGPDVGEVHHLFVTSWGDVWAWALRIPRAPYEQVFRSQDAGDTWQSIWNLPNNFNGLLAEDKDGNLYNMAGDAGIYRSVDRGESWVYFALAGHRIYQLFFTSSGAWLASAENGLFRTRDQGAEWQYEELLTSAFHKFIESPNGYIFALSQELGIFRSSDGGASWEPKNDGIPVSGYEYALALQSPAQLLAGLGRNGVYSSTDNGEHWQYLALEQRSIIALAIDKNGDIFAGTVSEGLYRSKDGGRSWRQTNTGINAAYIRQLEAKSQGEIFAVITDNTLYRSKNNGFDWELIPTTNLLRIKVDSDDTLWAFTYPDIIIAPDEPEKTRKVNFLPANQAAIAITFTQKYGVTVVSAKKEVYSSLDRGITWRRRGALDDTIQVEKLASDISSHFYVMSNRDAYYSDDGGVNWERIYTARPNDWLRDIAFDALGRIYMATSNGLLRSWKSFYNWDTLLPELSLQYIAISSTGVLATATSQGDVFFSADNGVKWYSEQTGMGSQVIRALIISAENYIYAGTQAFGVFRTAHKLAFPSDEHSSPIQNFPNPFNTMTNIQFKLAGGGYTQAAIYNILGQKVETLVEMELPAGIYTVSWQPTGLAGGIYFCQLKTAKGIETKKLLLVP